MTPRDPVRPAEEELLHAGGIALVGEIGRGSSGVVYRGRHLLLDRTVALKRIAIDPQDDAQLTGRLETEIAALVRLEHPAVVRLLDVKATAGALWLVMEYVDGPTLQAVLARHPGGLAPADALAVLEQLSSALSHLARQGVIHRDVKPSNVFLCRPGRCKLGDFGIALLDAAGGAAGRQTVSSDARVTRPGTILGTPSYLSPEQAEGREANIASDVYSLGVVAYELLVGRLPFPFRGNLVAVLASHAGKAPPPPRSLRPELSEEVDVALLRALEKEPARRPASAAEFWQHLDRGAAATWPRWRQEADLDGLVAASSTMAAGSGAAGSGAAGSAVAPGAGTVEEAGTLAGMTSMARVTEAVARRAEAAASTPDPLTRGPTPRRREPSGRSKPALRWVLLGALFVLAGGGSFLGVHALTGSAPAAPLRVQSVALVLHVQSRGGGCGSVTVVARLRLGGGEGTLRYEWSTPQGSFSGGVPVAAGRRTVTFERRFGLQSPHETIRLRLLNTTGGRATSLRVSASC